MVYTYKKHAVCTRVEDTNYSTFISQGLVRQYMSKSTTPPTDAVESFIDDHEPVDQSEIRAEFGRQGLVALRTLMRKNRISYTLEYDLQTEPDDRHIAPHQ